MHRIKAIAVGIKDFFTIILKLFISTEESWKMIKEYSFDWKEVFFYFAFPLIVISSLGRVLAVPEESVFKAITPNLLLISFVFSTSISIPLGAYMVKLLAPRYLSVADFNIVFTHIAFAYTPLFISNIIAAIHPSLAVVSLIGIFYTVFVFWKGMEIMLETPIHRRMGFTIICFLILFASAIIISAFTNYALFYFTDNMELIMQQ